VGVTVYSKPACVQCNATYRALDKRGIDYTVVDLTTDPESLTMVQALGHMQAPVVFIDESNHWSGYRPDRINALAEQLSSGTAGLSAAAQA
jgi:glutaredoxin-like protein NrdH